MSETIRGEMRRTARAPANEPALVCREAQVKQPFHYWRGASGARYLHTVFALIDCPMMGKVNYILVRRDRDGTRRPLDIGQTVSDCDSLNRAYLRRRAALMSANEVHVHFLPETAIQCQAAEEDLSSRQLGRTPAIRLSAPANDSTGIVCA